MVGWGAGFVAAYLALFMGRRPVEHVADRLHEWWWDGYGEWPSGGAVHRVIDLFGHAVKSVTPLAYLVALVAATALVPLGYLARTVVRARVRAGHADALDRARSWVSVHARAVQALTAMAGYGAGLSAASSVVRGWTEWREWLQNFASYCAWGIVGVLAGAVFTWLARAGLKALLAPTLSDAQPERADVRKDEITFDAVAVTFETRAAVGALAVWTVVACVLPWLWNSTPSFVGYVEVGYLVAAFAAAVGFRHASKIAVGVDGVLVKGTSRTRFFAYRDLEGVRGRNGEIELLRGERAVLRLQLHGADAARRDAIVARIGASIERARSAEDVRAVELVTASSPYQLGRVASGGADYRVAALTRDELWALVEGPAIDAPTRTAAAEALVKTGDGDERARLRVVAATCAQPAVRVALEELAEIEAEEAAESRGRLA
jgi:hypothetical protein